MKIQEGLLGQNAEEESGRAARGAGERGSHGGEEGKGTRVVGG